MTQKNKPAAGATGPRLEAMPLSLLLKMAHKRNPKDHHLDSLIESFLRFGFKAFPTIDEATQVMVAGHGRCEALEIMRTRGQAPPENIVEEGTEWMVPVVRGQSFKSERERDAFVIADNQQVMAGGWKFEILSELIGGLKDDGGFAGLGFEEIELNALLGQHQVEAPDDGDDPEDRDGNKPSGNKGRTEITARIECPSCGHKFER